METKDFVLIAAGSALLAELMMSSVHRHPLAPVTLEEKVPVYRINGEMMTEESIIGLTQQKH